MHAHNVSTATLNVCGALDRCTPSEEARQFHSALVENGVESILVTYSEEGTAFANCQPPLITLPV
jgi:dipeptidyl aminopeptidase/acylaminoacyl peptidase